METRTLALSLSEGMGRGPQTPGIDRSFGMHDQLARSGPVWAHTSSQYAYLSVYTATGVMSSDGAFRHIADVAFACPRPHFGVRFTSRAGVRHPSSAPSPPDSPPHLHIDPAHRYSSLPRRWKRSRGTLSLPRILPCSWMCPAAKPRMRPFPAARAARRGSARPAPRTPQPRRSGCWPLPRSRPG